MPKIAFYITHNFAGTVAFFGGKENHFSIIIYIGTAMSVALWVAIMFMPIIQVNILDGNFSDSNLNINTMFPTLID